MIQWGGKSGGSDQSVSQRNARRRAGPVRTLAGQRILEIVCELHGGQRPLREETGREMVDEGEDERAMEAARGLDRGIG